MIVADRAGLRIAELGGLTVAAELDELGDAS
jgi:hypothetical protein